MPHTALESDVREECQNILPVDFPDAEITKELDAAYDFVSLRIGEYNVSHPKINAVKKVEIKLASCFVLGHFKQYLDTKNTKCVEGKEMLTEMQSSLSTAAQDIEYKHTFTDYGSWPAAFQEDENTETRPYKSTNSFVY